MLGSPGLFLSMPIAPLLWKVADRLSAYWLQRLETAPQDVESYHLRIRAGYHVVIVSSDRAVPVDVSNRRVQRHREPRSNSRRRVGSPIFAGPSSRKLACRCALPRCAYNAFLQSLLKRQDLAFVPVCPKSTSV
jgi:hypothetical protein